MKRRLSAILDGNPVYLYEFVCGSYEDRRQLLYAHAEELSCTEIINRFRAALATLPAEIEDYDYMKAEPDLFERALELAGFVCVRNEVPIGLWLRGVGNPSLYRDGLVRSLDRFDFEMGLRNS